MASSSHDGTGEGDRYPTVGPEAAVYEDYDSREDGDGFIRVYECGQEEAGAWLASTLALSRTSLR